MKIKYYLLLLLGLAITLNSCKSDDGLIDPVPIADRGEQQIIDKAELIEYLSSHYYNSNFFRINPDATINDLVITKLEDGQSVPTNHRLLMDAVVTETTTYEEVEYDYHILTLQQGGGEAPHFSDRVRLIYQGFTLDSNANNLSEAFDSSPTPVEFELVSLIRGWPLVIPEFNVADSFMENGDGTITYNNPGRGVMFIPSGLAYFNQVTAGIVEYSELLFKFELYQTEVADHDFDGLPSFVEDTNADLDVTNDDTDENGISNFNDPDDDGDGVLTFNELQQTEYEINVGDPDPTFGENEFEIIREEEGGKIMITTVKMVDANNNSIFDHLDAEATTNYNED